MKVNVIILLLVGSVVYAAQLGTLGRSSDVTTGAELATFAIDPASLQVQITSNTDVLTGGITTNLSNLVIVDGVVTGTY